MKSTIIVAGALAQRPGQAGHTWQYLQYLLGFKRLGWDVLFLDRLEPDMCVDAGGQPCQVEQSENLRYFLEVMHKFSLQDAFSLIGTEGTHILGLTRAEVLERAKRCAFLLNVMGFLTDEEILGAVPKRVFLDTDPGFGQMWQDLGLADVFDGHDDYVTIGENIGAPQCAIPACGLRWIPWRQPVVLEYWPCTAASDTGAYTSIGAWRGPYGPLEYKGATYGLRVHEFRKFMGVPRVTGQQFEIALDIHPTETDDLAGLVDNQWRLADPQVIARDPQTYQTYIRDSKAEFMVAKNMYVQSNSGWFSERSICYLASGKPVLAQDTGIRRHYPTDKGLVAFSTLEEAVAGVEQINADYAQHARAAREIAVEFFDSDKVLRQLLQSLGIE